MADIAILVAEEYERRTKRINSGAGAGTGQEEETGLLSHVVTVSVKRVQVLMKNKMEEILEEPKSEISLAARNGVFSA